MPTTNDSNLLCRYRCDSPVTHFCHECAEGLSGLGGYFCAAHAAWHNRLVREGLGTTFAVALADSKKENS